MWGVSEPCPKCHFSPPERAGPLRECPRCGVVFAKVRPPPVVAPERPAAPVPEEPPPPAPSAFTAGVALRPSPEEVAQAQSPLPRERWVDRLLVVPARVDPMTWWGRAALLAVLAVWGGSLMWGGWEGQRAFRSVLHLPNLAFHEFGHVLFAPLGTFLMFLGGSLFQVGLPFGIALAFALRQRDPIGAAACLWWTGENLLDLAPYIGDARSRAMILVSEAVSGELGDRDSRALSHDWHNLLSTLGVEHWDHELATFTFGLGCVLMVGAIAWGAYVLHLQRARLTSPMV